MVVIKKKKKNITDSRNILKEFELLRMRKKIGDDEKHIKEATKSARKLQQKIDTLHDGIEGGRRLVLQSILNNATKTINNSVVELNKSIDEYEKFRKSKKFAPMSSSLVTSINDQQASSQTFANNNLAVVQYEPIYRPQNIQFSQVANQRQTLESFRNIIKNYPRLINEKLHQYRKFLELYEKLENILPYEKNPFNVQIIKQRFKKYEDAVPRLENEIKMMQAQLRNAQEILHANAKQKFNRNSSVLSSPLIINQNFSRRSIEKINIIEKEAKQKIFQLRNMRIIHLKEILKCRETIKDLDENLRRTSEVVRLPQQFYLDEIKLEKKILEINGEKLKRVNTTLMQLCNQILNDDQNSNLTEEFIIELKNILQELKQSGVNLSTAITTKKRRQWMVPLKDLSRIANNTKTNYGLNFSPQKTPENKILPLKPKTQSKWLIKKQLEDSFDAKITLAKEYKEQLHKAIDDSEFYLNEMNHYLTKSDIDQFEISHKKYQNSFQTMLLLRKMLNSVGETLMKMKRNLVSPLNNLIIPEDLFTLQKSSFPLKSSHLVQKNEEDLQKQFRETLVRWRSVKHLPVNDPRYAHELNELLKLQEKFYTWLVHKMTRKTLPQGFFVRQPDFGDKQDG